MVYSNSYEVEERTKMMLYEAVANSLELYLSVALDRFRGEKHRFVYYCRDNGRYYYRSTSKCRELVKIKTENIAEFISSKEVVMAMRWIIDNKIAIPIEVFDPISRQFVFDCGLINVFQDSVAVVLWRTCSETILRELERLKTAPFKIELIAGLEDHFRTVLSIPLQSSRASKQS